MQRCVRNFTIPEVRLAWAFCATASTIHGRGSQNGIGLDRVRLTLCKGGSKAACNRRRDLGYA